MRAAESSPDTGLDMASPAHIATRMVMICIVVDVVDQVISDRSRCLMMIESKMVVSAVEKEVRMRVPFDLYALDTD